MERLERTATGIDTIDDDRTERLTSGCFEGRLPTGIDIDEIEQGAEHPSDSSETFGSSCGAGLIERQCQCLGAGLPCVVIALGGTMGGFGGVHCSDRCCHPMLNILHGGDKRFLRRLGLRELGTQASGLDHALLGLGGQHRGSGGDALALLAAAIGGGPQRTELAAHLGGGTGGGRDPRGPFRFERESLGGERTLRRSQFEGHRFELGRLCLHCGQFGGESGGLGLERGHDALIDGCSAGSFDATAAFGQHCGETACLLEQRLIESQTITDVVTTHRRELRLSGHDLGVELGQSTAESFIGGDEFGPTARALFEACTQTVEFATSGEDP